MRLRLNWRSTRLTPPRHHGLRRAGLPDRPRRRASARTALVIPGGQDLRQQPRLLDEGAGDEIGEAEQGQQGLDESHGQGVMVGRQL